MKFSFSDRMDFPEKFHPTNGVGVEVCVDAGNWSEHVLLNWSGKLIGVDPYSAYEERMAPMLDRMSVFCDRFQHIRLDSVEASKMFNDGSLDFVYIDADHSESAVREDIRAWLPKVKLGGIICGHDFHNHCGVIKPVVEVALDVLKTELRVTPCTSWWIRVPQTHKQ